MEISAHNYNLPKSLESSRNDNVTNCCNEESRKTSNYFYFLREKLVLPLKTLPPVIAEWLCKMKLLQKYFFGRPLTLMAWYLSWLKSGRANDSPSGHEQSLFAEMF